jgi:hypothetical protein
VLMHVEAAAVAQHVFGSRAYTATDRSGPAASFHCVSDRVPTSCGAPIIKASCTTTLKTLRELTFVHFGFLRLRRVSLSSPQENQK